jgi:hypothetical protein
VRMAVGRKWLRMVSNAEFGSGRVELLDLLPKSSNMTQLRKGN